MSADARGGVIVFDGVCLLREGWIRFLVRRDPAGRFRFAATQSTRGRESLVQHGLDPDDPASFLVVEDDRTWRDSDAVLRVLACPGTGSRLLARGAAFDPQRLRDAAYRQFARHRYRWSGRRADCRVPTPDEAGRFLD